MQLSQWTALCSTINTLPTWIVREAERGRRVLVLGRHRRVATRAEVVARPVRLAVLACVPPSGERAFAAVARDDVLVCLCRNEQQRQVCANVVSLRKVAGYYSAPKPGWMVWSCWTHQKTAPSANELGGRPTRQRRMFGFRYKLLVLVRECLLSQHERF